MKNKKTLIVTIVVVLLAVGGNFFYNKLFKEKEIDGSKKITVTVINESKNYNKEHIIKTDLGNLGEALEESGFVGFDKQQADRFIVTVDDIKADSTKQEWWNVTVNGKNAEVGVDDIVITEGDKFELILKTGW